MGVHCIRTRAPALVSVWQESLPGSVLAGGAADPACTTGTIAAGRRAAGALWTVLALTAELRTTARDGRSGGGRGATAGTAAATAGSGAAGSSLWSTTGAGPVLGCQGVQLVRRTKASRVGLVMTSTEGIDCMHPDRAMAAQHRPARFAIDSIIAHSVADRSKARQCRPAPQRQVNPVPTLQFRGAGRCAVRFPQRVMGVGPAGRTSGPLTET